MTEEMNGEVVPAEEFQGRKLAQEAGMGVGEYVMLLWGRAEDLERTLRDAEAKAWAGAAGAVEREEHRYLDDAQALGKAGVAWGEMEFRAKAAACHGCVAAINAQRESVKMSAMVKDVMKGGEDE